MSKTKYIICLICFECVEFFILLSCFGLIATLDKYLVCLAHSILSPCNNVSHSSYHNWWRASRMRRRLLYRLKMKKADSAENSAKSKFRKKIFKNLRKKFWHDICLQGSQIWRRICYKWAPLWTEEASINQLRELRARSTEHYQWVKWALTDKCLSHWIIMKDPR